MLRTSYHCVRVVTSQDALHGAIKYNEVMVPADGREVLTQIFHAALQAVDPYALAAVYSEKIRAAFLTCGCRRLVVIGFGKASCPMAKALEDRLDDLIDSGIVITKYGHCSQNRPQKIHVIEGGHPLPDENGLRGTEELIEVLRYADETTFIVCLISGGGSALLVGPYEGITLDAKKQITELLLRAGADIYELNTVRKHISAVKGGRLAEIARHARVLSLVLSDVIGDPLDVIASGPTTPDQTTHGEALRVLEKYRLIDASPRSVLEVLQKGTAGLIPETPKEGTDFFDNVKNVIIANNKTALEAARQKAEAMKFSVEMLSSALTGEAREVGRWLAQKALDMKNSEGGPRCLISGGETTVTVGGPGRGGRNMELALSFAMEIEGVAGIRLLSAGTDGTDGPTDAAGAIVDGATTTKAKSAGLNPGEYLNNNDSYAFFKRIDGLFITGPTGTNVMDIQITVVE